MNTDLLIKLLETSREGNVFNIAKKEISSRLDCYHDMAGDFCFFTPKKGQEVLPILLVAHVDTVDFSGKRTKVVEDNGVLINENGVLGADDRAGVFIITQLIKKLKAVPYVLLTNGEEIGGLGVKAFCDSNLLKPYLKKINLFVEFDRRGVNQFVMYEKASSELVNLFENYGYEKQHGSYSDVATLSRTYKTAHVNLSAAYFNEHTNSEYCSLAGIEFAINNALVILPLIKKRYKIKKDTEKFDWKTYYKKGAYKKYTIEDDDYETFWQENYGSLKKETKTAPTDNPLTWECPLCGSINVQWVDHNYMYCNDCKEYYDLNDATSNLI